MYRELDSDWAIYMVIGLQNGWIYIDIYIYIYVYIYIYTYNYIELTSDWSIVRVYLPIESQIGIGNSI